ncbi:hypothetical protein NDU88_006163 [Pleurodeles waltl]|uniref:Uncharacterized protein n=1 Tax=Pleurodeles waltl TaxID=8319 RepID=A0AAV7WCT2_PLEWA|nr:hypothetical protein NDU88_006163 [Pleurodeles waltl]
MQPSSAPFFLEAVLIRRYVNTILQNPSRTTAIHRSCTHPAAICAQSSVSRSHSRVKNGYISSRSWPDNAGPTQACTRCGTATTKVLSCFTFCRRDPGVTPASAPTLIVPHRVSLAGFSCSPDSPCPPS